jgi:hypothetical protein
VAKLTREQERLHAQACQLIELDRDLTEDERLFVLDNWQESSTSTNASDRAFFTPAGLAGDMSIEVDGLRIIDLAAGIGRLAFHNREIWPHRDVPEFVCVERNPAYVRVGRRVMPEATWICADILDLPDRLDELGEFSCAISNPPFGPVPRQRNAPGGYVGRRFEYHAIAVAALLARRGVFIIPQVAAPFCYSGRPRFEHDTGDAEYRKFSAVTGIELTANCGIDTSYYDGQWHGVCPRVEIVKADFTERRQPIAPPAARRAEPAAPVAVPERAGQLALLAL